jgi:hypothetical protein
MRVDRVDAAMAIRPYMVPALKREFLSSGFDRELPDEPDPKGCVIQSSAAKDRFSKPTTAVQSRRREPFLMPDTVEKLD